MSNPTVEVLMSDDHETTAQAKERRGRDLDRRFELFEAILMAIATVLTAWSAFQSTKWGGEQADAENRAAAERTESVKASTLAGQQTSIDVAVFLQWLAAYNSERQADPSASIGPDGSYQPDPTTLSGFLYARFRSEFAPAFQAWLAERPLSNPAAAPTPFQRPEYQLAATANAAALEARAVTLSAGAQRANDRSDAYVFLTVLFASVLFFAGISSKMDTLKARLVLQGAAMVLLVGGLVLLAFMPRRF